MCLAFLQYYPKVALSHCISGPGGNAIAEIYDGTVVWW